MPKLKAFQCLGDMIFKYVYVLFLNAVSLSLSYIYIYKYIWEIWAPILIILIQPNSSHDCDRIIVGIYTNARYKL